MACFTYKAIYMLVHSLHGHYSFHYYELVRLIISPLSNLGYKYLLWHTSLLLCFKYPILKNIWVLTGMLNITLIYSPCSTDPGDTFTISCFTFSYYGSYFCLPTLKPYLTISAPSLTNGSLLEITMLNSHQLYIKHRTSAHSL